MVDHAPMMADQNRKVGVNNMLVIKDIRGKKANQIRWNAFKLLDWEKDGVIIETIAKISNPKFFSSRTPEKCIAEIREEIALEAKFKL